MLAYIWRQYVKRPQRRRELLRRNLPVIYVRLLCNLYTNYVAHMSRNGMLSKVFTTENGVKQGGIVSPVLFFIYIDGILRLLR